jgi:hypothetical protein
MIDRFKLFILKLLKRDHGTWKGQYELHIKDGGCYGIIWTDDIKENGFLQDISLKSNDSDGFFVVRNAEIKKFEGGVLFKCTTRPIYRAEIEA